MTNDQTRGVLLLLALAGLVAVVALVVILAQACD